MHFSPCIILVISLFVIIIIIIIFTYKTTLKVSIAFGLLNLQTQLAKLLGCPIHLIMMMMMTITMMMIMTMMMIVRLTSVKTVARSTLRS